MSTIALIRPHDWDLPLIVHIFGAMVLVGALALSAVSLIASWRSGSAALTKLGFMSLFYGALPGYIVMRGGAQWIAHKEGLENSDISWINIGFSVSDLGFVLLVVSLVIGGIGIRKINRGEGGAPSISARIATGLISLFLVACLVAVWAMTRRRARHPAFGGLNQQPSLAGEGHLHGFAGAAPDERLQVDVGLDRGLDVLRPGDRRLRVREGLIAVELQQHRGAVREHRDVARAGEVRVEHAAAHESGDALDLPDVPVDIRVERQEVCAVHGYRLTGELHQLDLLSEIGEEHLAAAGDLHQLGALAGDRLLRHPLQAAGAGVLELDIALVGDHRAQLRLDRLPLEPDLEHLGPLHGERLVARRLLELLEGSFDRHCDLLVIKSSG
jgi:hypothetical protein